MKNIPNTILDQKSMLERYAERYRAYNAQCESLVLQNRGGQYATGYRCLVNFCTSFHKGKAFDCSFETSYALLAQDWGKEQSAKSVKRHLCRLSAEVVLLQAKCGQGGAGLTLFSKLEEVRRGGFLHVRLCLHPSFIVFADGYRQAMHEESMRRAEEPPPKEPALDRAEQPENLVRRQMLDRLSRAFKVI